jgi:methyl-accepting chemotaxis protein
MKIRFPIGYKFICGFIVVVAVAAFVPKFVADMEVAEWTKEPLSLLIAIFIGLAIGHIFTRRFTSNVSLLTAMAQRISRGDLSHTGTTGAASKLTLDETSDLEDALLQMVKNLKGLIRHIQDAVTNLTESHDTFNTLISKGHETSRVVMNDTSKIFSGALEQASHVENTSKTVKELTELADEVATKVTDTANASQKVDSMVHRGANTATSAIEKMETIFKGIEKTESAAKRLEDKINDIPKILDVITHISRQTDLLALNATIEASKAGEHGRGFALVAEEVRRFADNTNRSVEDVDTIVKALKGEVEGVVNSASESTSFITEGRDDMRKVRDILGDITQYASEVAEKSTLILALTQKQKEMADNSVETFDEVAKIAHDNLSATEGVEKAVEEHGSSIEETFKASQNLSKLSEELNDIVSTFKVSEGD